MHLKKIKKNNNKLNIILLIIILVIIVVIYLLNTFNKKAIPYFLEYSEMETKKLITNIVNSTITNEISTNTNIDDLFLTSKENNDIKSIDFKSNEVNKLLVMVSKKVDDNLKEIENGVIFKIPSGLIFNNSLLYNVFPKIPVKIEPIGSVICKLTTDIESYGINNALIKVNIDVETDIKILLPFTSKIKTYTISNPIIIKVIEGNVPSYYLNGYLDIPIASSKQ